MALHPSPPQAAESEPEAGGSWPPAAGSWPLADPEGISLMYQLRTANNVNNVHNRINNHITHNL